MKKLIALVLAMLMVLSMGSVAFAKTANDGTVLPEAVFERTGSDEIGGEDEPWNTSWSLVTEGKVEIPFLYTFTAQDEAGAHACDQWKCDFVVSLNRDIKDGEFYLVGNYGDFNWIAITADVPGNTEFNLVSTMLGEYSDPLLKYNDICGFVKTFKCSAFAGDGMKEDVVLTVKLCMWDPEGTRYVLNEFVEVIPANTTVSKDFVEEDIADSSTEVVKLPEATTSNVTVSNETLEAIATANKAVTITTPAATVTIPADVLDTVLTKAGSLDVTVSLTKADSSSLEPEQQLVLAEYDSNDIKDIFRAEIIANNAVISDAFGGNTVTVAFYVGDEGRNCGILYVADNGEADIIPSVYENGYLVAELEHFSEYVIINGLGVPTVAHPGQKVIVSNAYDRAAYKVYSYDFTSGTRDFRGAGYIEDVKITKDNELIIFLKESYTLATDKAVKGEIIVQNKETKVKTPVSVEFNLQNNVTEVYGSTKAKDATDLNNFGGDKVFGDNCVIIMDEDGGYVYFTEEMLKGVVKMNKEEKTFLNVIYGGQEETVEAIEELLGEEYLEEAIIEYYTFETRAFKNEVAFSYEAYEDDPHFFYLYNDGKLTKIDAVYDADEDVEAWVWTAIAEGTIIVTDVEIVLADEETKNPDTGANDVVGIAAALAVTSLVAAAAVSLKK